MLFLCRHKIAILLFIAILVSIGFCFADSLYGKLLIALMGFFIVAFCYLFSSVPPKIFNVEYSKQGVLISKKMYSQLSKNIRPIGADKLKQAEDMLMAKVNNNEITMEEFEEKFFSLIGGHVEERYTSTKQKKEEKILIPWNDVENWEFEKVKRQRQSASISMKAYGFNQRFRTDFYYKYFEEYLKDKQINRNAIKEFFECIFIIIGISIIGSIFGLVAANFICNTFGIAKQIH